VVYGGLLGVFLFGVGWVGVWVGVSGGVGGGGWGVLGFWGVGGGSGGGRVWGLVGWGGGGDEGGFFLGVLGVFVGGVGGGGGGGDVGGGGGVMALTVLCGWGAFLVCGGGWVVFCLSAFSAGRFPF